MLGIVGLLLVVTSVWLDSSRTSVRQILSRMCLYGAGAVLGYALGVS